VARLAKERQGKRTDLEESVTTGNIAQISGRSSKEDSSDRTNRQMSNITGIAHGTVAKYNYVRDNAERLDEAGISREQVRKIKKLKDYSADISPKTRQKSP
jgi:cation transport regulator ChaC